MKFIIQNTVIIIFCILFTLLIPNAFGDNEIGVVIPICTEPDDQSFPVIYGDYIVWQDYRNRNWDIFMYDLKTEVETPICTNGGSQHSLAIYGDRIIWIDTRDHPDSVYMYDIKTKEEIRITNETTYIEGKIDIFGDKITFGENVGFTDENILLYDLSTKETIQIAPKARDYDFHNDRIVWREYRGYSWSIFMYDLNNGEETKITSAKGKPSIYGNYIVWVDYRDSPGEDSRDNDIYIYDLLENKEIKITNDDHFYDSPRIFEDKIVWYKHDGFSGGLYLYNISTRQETPIYTKIGYISIEHFDFYNNIVVWGEYVDGETNIYMYEIPNGSISSLTIIFILSAILVIIISSISIGLYLKRRKTFSHPPLPPPDFPPPPTSK